MAISKIRLLMTSAVALFSCLCLFSTAKSKRSCLYVDIPSTGPLKSKLQNVNNKTIIRFTCKANYILVGEKAIRCKDGRWIGKIPYCKDINENIFQRLMNFLLRSLFKHLVLEPREVICNDPGDIPFGKKNEDQEFYRPGATVRYRCDKNFEMRKGSSSIRCTNNGTWNNSPPICIYCRSSLGMDRSGPRLIPDARIRGSSEKDDNHKAFEGRLNGPRAWCSGRERTPYIEVDLGRTHKIVSLATQGSAFDKKWVRWYAVKRSLRGLSFATYRENDREKMFRGNEDASSIVIHELKNPIFARKIRFYPLRSGGFTSDHACMRVEIYGCELFH